MQVSALARVPAGEGGAIDRDETKRRTLPLLCECGDVGCDSRVPLTAAEYRALPRAAPGLALAPGHGLDEWLGDRDRGDGRRRRGR
jgi:hypothetical protein